MTPQQFVDKWRPVTLSERAAAQSHFRDLCQLFDHPDPIAADPIGEWFTFEKGVPKSGGGDGFADVWKKNHFAWEYKKKRRNLEEALGQLARYALGLENPPLHIVCDTDQFRIVTAWTNSIPRSYDFALNDLLDSTKRSWLESAFYRPDRLKPGGFRADLTKVAADKFSALATCLRARGHSPENVAHFVNRLVFLFFAEDVKLLPDGYFRRILRECAAQPRDSLNLLNQLFSVLHKGGRFGIDRLPYINGGLFDDSPSLEINDAEVSLLIAAGSEDWSHIDPTIFGTLFERFLDPDKRAQIGAHYTDAEKILRIIEPVIAAPLRAEWATAKADIERLTEKARTKGQRAKEWQRAEERRSQFLERLRKLSILDPACGSGNFLYLALHAVKDIEHCANQECEALDLPPRMPVVGPEILRGIEINPLAAELARTTVWIGDIQWAIKNGIYSRPEPILRRLDAIECRDALITTAGGKADWPKADFIVGNPPFLGDKLMISALGEDYVKSVRKSYRDEVPGGADLVCYWFAKARTAIDRGDTLGSGLVATNSIRGGANNLPVKAIVESCNLHEVWSDEPWVIDGAAVRVSLLCFAAKSAFRKIRLDGWPVESIAPNLASSISTIHAAEKLSENAAVSFIGTQKNGSFDVSGEIARRWLKEPVNPNGRPNSDVVRPWSNGSDLMRRSSGTWIIDFGTNMSKADACLYGSPFAHVQQHVYPEREGVRRDGHRQNWWRHGETRAGLRAALKGRSRYLATARVAKHRVFCWLDVRVVPDCQLVVFARDDDTFFGIMSSKFHERWSILLGTSLEDRPRYTPTSSFETYPFPDGLTPDIDADRYALDPRAIRIAAAAKKLDDYRRAWLNPPDMVKVVPEVAQNLPDRILPVNAEAAVTLQDRTLTKLYNKRLPWLEAAHEELDCAVAAAYGWPEDITTEEALVRLLDLNRRRFAEKGRTLESSGTRLPALPVTLPLARDGVRKRRARSQEVLHAVADASVVLTPSHLASVGGEVGSADAMVDTHLGPAQASEE